MTNHRTEYRREHERQLLAARKRQAAPSVYQQLVAAGVELDSHESDLYALDTPAARAIVANSGRSWSRFISNRDGRAWLEVPFAFEAVTALRRRAAVRS